MVKLFFDILHGIKVSDITFVVALEFAVLLGFDGQLKQNSDLEMELFTSIVEQLKKSNMTKIENALVWLYVKSWNHFGQHLLDEKSLWNFGSEDLESALTAVAYQKKKDKNERFQDLKNLIMERFDNNVIDFFEWTRYLHNEVLISYNMSSDFKEACFFSPMSTSFFFIRTLLFIFTYKCLLP